MTTLYRLFDARGDLLYVGIAEKWTSRMGQHHADKPWFADVASVRLEDFPTREDALAAERQAIIDEKPRHNVVHNRGRQQNKARRVVTRRPAEKPEWDDLIRSWDHSHVRYECPDEYQAARNAIDRLCHATIKAGLEMSQPEWLDLVRECALTNPYGDMCRQTGSHCKSYDLINWPWLGERNGHGITCRYKCANCGRVWETWWHVDAPLMIA